MNLSLELIKNEIKNPRFKVLRNILHILYSLKNFSKTKSKKKYKAILIWDIRCNSISFDFIYIIFYIYSCLKRKHNIIRFDFVIYLPDDFLLKPFSTNNYSSYVSSEELKSRVDNIILPLAQSFNCIDKIILLNKENDVLDIIKNSDFVYPRNYNPIYFTIEPLDYLKTYKYLKSPKVLEIPYLISKDSNINDFNIFDKKLKYSDYITFTIRDYGFSPVRNTKYTDIEKVYKVAESLNCKLVIVPDDICKIRELSFASGVIICESARKDIFHRIKLYSNSKLNIFNPSGPSHVSLFTRKTKTIITNFCAGGFDSNEKLYKKEYNISVGNQPYEKLGCFILWHKIFPDYTTQDILKAYEILCQKNY